MPIENKAPTIEQEMAKFGGYATNNGVVVDAKTTTTSAGDVNLSDDEREAGITIVGETPRNGAAKADKADKTPAIAKVELTDAEADAALEAARTAAKLGDGEELTKEEEDAALLAALSAKKDAAKPAVSDRVKRAQDGRRRAEARASRAEASLATMEARLAALENGGTKTLTGDAKPVKGAADADKEPDPKDFEFGEVDAKFIRALARWEAKQVIADSSKNQQTARTTAEQAAAAEEFAEKKSAFEDAGLDQFDDFQEVVLDTLTLPKSDPAAWPLSATVGQLLLESEHGPAIAYQLAGDPKEAKRVAALPPLKQASWFGVQEAKAEAAAASKVKDGEKAGTKEAEGAGRQESKELNPRAVTRAPIPLNRGRGQGGNKQPSAATTDFAAFEALAQQPAKR